MMLFIRQYRIKINKQEVNCVRLLEKWHTIFQLLSHLSKRIIFHLISTLFDCKNYLFLSYLQFNLSYSSWSKTKLLSWDSTSHSRSLIYRDCWSCISTQRWCVSPTFSKLLQIKIVKLKIFFFPFMYTFWKYTRYLEYVRCPFYVLKLLEDAFECQNM